MESALGEDVAAAHLYIAALGYGWVHVNGQPVSKELMTISAWSNNERRNCTRSFRLPLLLLPLPLPLVVLLTRWRPLLQGSPATTSPPPSAPPAPPPPPPAR